MKILAVTVTPSILTRRLFQIWKLSGRGKAAIGSEDDLKYTGFQAHKMPGSLFCQCLTWGFELWHRWTESENGLWESHSETAEEKVRRDGSGMDWAEIKVGNPHTLGFIHNLETSNWMSCTTQRAATTPVQHIDYLWPRQAPPCWLYMNIVIFWVEKPYLPLFSTVPPVASYNCCISNHQTGWVVTLSCTTGWCDSCSFQIHCDIV